MGSLDLSGQSAEIKATIIIYFFKKIHIKTYNYNQQSCQYDQRLEQQKELVSQLRAEATTKRINVSQAIEDLKKYVMEKQCEDVLLTGFSTAKQNPYWKKSTCTCDL